jgi:hypothetical protein
MLNHSLFRRHHPVREPVAPRESVSPAAAGRTRKLQRCSPRRTIRERCTATSSPSRGRASMTSTRLSCPHRLSLASQSRRTSARASSLARSRCQPTAVTPAGSSAVCPSGAARLGRRNVMPRPKAGRPGERCFSGTRIAASSSSPGWTRTNNPPVNSRMLCQLSYWGKQRGLV